MAQDSTALGSVRYFAFEGSPKPSDHPLSVGDQWWVGSIDSLAPNAARLVGEAVVPTALQGSAPLLVVTDADSTLINEEMIDQLADLAGVGTEVSRVTERAMNGELDFAQSLHTRVSLLSGLPESAIAEATSRLTLTRGAQELVDWTHSIGAKFGVVSGGFSNVFEPVAKALGVDYLLANRLEVKGRILTGRITGPIVTAESKVEQIMKWCSNQPELVVAAGDGANDIPMLQLVGVGFAFCAKAKVIDATSSRIDTRRLDLIPGLVGWGHENRTDYL